jgi:hypothetical protein
MSFYLPAIARSNLSTNGGKAQWATRLAGTGNEASYSIVSDSQNNLYVTGFYSSNPLTIYNADGTTFATLALTSATDAFLAKYNSSGQAQWATRISSSGGTGSDQGVQLCIDYSDNVYILGISTGTTLTINSYGSVSGGGAISLIQYGTLSLTSLGQCIFIVKYNSSSGQAQWATKIDGNGNYTPYVIKSDYSNNIYIVGKYTNQICNISNFVGGGGGGPITTSLYATLDSTNNPNGTIFITKYNSSGSGLWVTYLASTGNVGNYGGIGIDNSNNIYIASASPAVLTINSFGSIIGTTINETFYGNINPSGTQSIFLVKFNQFGIAQWATRIGGTSADFIIYNNSITLDSSQNVYICGGFQSNPLSINSFSSVSGGNVIVSTFGTLTNTGTESTYLVKYNSLGQVQWATKCESTISEGYGVITDLYQNVYMVGYYSSAPCTVYSYNGLSSPGGSINLTLYGTILPIGANNTLLVKFSSAGIVRWATNLGGNPNPNISAGLTRDNNNYIYISGVYSGSPLIINDYSTVSGGTINTTNFGSLANSGFGDVFIVKYSP